MIRKIVSVFFEGCALLAFILSIVFVGALINSTDPIGDGIVAAVGFLFAGVLMGIARFVEDE